MGSVCRTRVNRSVALCGSCTCCIRMTMHSSRYRKCRNAGWGCVECKQPVAEAIIAEQAPIHERAAQYEENPELLQRILSEGTEQARDEVRATLREVREAMGLTGI